MKSNDNKIIFYIASIINLADMLINVKLIQSMALHVVPQLKTIDTSEWFCMYSCT